MRFEDAYRLLAVPSFENLVPFLGEMRYYHFVLQLTVIYEENGPLMLGETLNNARRFLLRNRHVEKVVRPVLNRLLSVRFVLGKKYNTGTLQCALVFDAITKFESISTLERGPHKDERWIEFDEPRRELRTVGRELVQYET
jgi:hypothetical protein